MLYVGLDVHSTQSSLIYGSKRKNRVDTQKLATHALYRGINVGGPLPCRSIE